MAIKVFTTGEVLTSSDTNTYLANSGLVYVTSKKVTSGSTISVTSCFNSSFKNYRIVFSELATTAAASSNITLQIGTTAAPSTYYYNGTYMNYNSSTVIGINGNGVAQWDSNIVTDTTFTGGSLDLFNVFLAKRTTVTILGGDSRTNGGGARLVTGVHATDASYDGFVFTTGSAFTSGTITVYGYREG